MKPAQPTELTFWDHLDELRRTIIHIACAVIVLMLLAFCFKEELFGLILAPKERDFCTYRLFAWLGEVLHISGLETETLPVKLINTQLSGQFLTHMSVSFYAGILLASPYILYQLFRFVSPALYQKEKEYSRRLVFWGYLLFLPLSFNVPGEPGDREHHPAQFLHRHVEHAEPDDGHHV